MSFEDWKRKIREKELERINKELEELKEKGPTFEKKVAQRRKQTKNKNEGANIILLVLIILLAIGWAVTFIVYWTKNNNLQGDLEDLNKDIDAKVKEMEEMNSQVGNLTVLVEKHNKDGNELNQELKDATILNAELENEIDDLKSENTALKLNLTIQNSIVSSYKLCITDKNGDINQSISVCDDYI